MDAKLIKCFMKRLNIGNGLRKFLAYYSLCAVRTNGYNTDFHAG